MLDEERWGVLREKAAAYAIRLITQATAHAKGEQSMNTDRWGGRPLELLGASDVAKARVSLPT